MSSTFPATALAVSALLTSGIAFAWSAVSDIRSYEIPNTASAVIVIGYAVFAFCVPSAPRLGAAAVGLAVFALGLVLFARGSMGGGDVKLLAAASVWTGPHLLAPFAIVTGLAGALLAGFLISPLSRVMPRAPRDVTDAAGAGALRQPMPFGFAIAAGGLFVLSQQSSLIH